MSQYKDEITKNIKNLFQQGALENEVLADGKVLADGIEAIYEEYTPFCERHFGTKGFVGLIGHLIAFPFRMLMTIADIMCDDCEGSFDILSPAYWRRNFLVWGKTVTINELIFSLKNKAPIPSTEDWVLQKSLLPANADNFKKISFLRGCRQKSYTSKGSAVPSDVTNDILDGLVRVIEEQAFEERKAAATHRLAGVSVQGSAFCDPPKCSITLENFSHPETTVDGHMYDREAIQAWFNTMKFRSPMTNEPLADTTLTYNGRMMSYIKAYEENDTPGMLASFLMPNESNNGYVVMHSLWLVGSNGTYALEPSANQDPPAGFESSVKVHLFKDVVPGNLKGKTLEEAVALITEPVPTPAPPPARPPARPHQFCCAMM
jgi:hypothetical protein